MSEDKPKRSYAKASYKTKPYAVRFDTEKFDFFMKREKLQTAQQLVDHFLNSYWWQWKVAKPTHKDVPLDELKSEINYSESTPAAFDGKMKRTVLDEPAMWQTEKPKINQFDAYKNDILETTYSGDLEKVMKIIKADTSIPKWQQIQLQAFADTHRLEFTN